AEPLARDPVQRGHRGAELPADGRLLGVAAQPRERRTGQPGGGEPVRSLGQHLGNGYVRSGPADQPEVLRLGGVQARLVPQQPYLRRRRDLDHSRTPVGQPDPPHGREAAPVELLPRDDAPERTGHERGDLVQFEAPPGRAAHQNPNGSSGAGSRSTSTPSPRRSATKSGYPRSMWCTWFTSVTPSAHSPATTSP